MKLTRNTVGTMPLPHWHTNLQSTFFAAIMAFATYQHTFLHAGEAM